MGGASDSRMGRITEHPRQCLTRDCPEPPSRGTGDLEWGSGYGMVYTFRLQGLQFPDGWDSRLPLFRVE